MSDRRRRTEISWDKKEESMPPAETGGKIPWQGKDHSSFHGDSSPKWSKLEANDGVMTSDFSRRPSWEPLQGNGNMPKDDVIKRDRHRMQTDHTFDERGKQYSYDRPYRGRDGEGGSGSMSRDRDRDRDRDRSRNLRRSRSRSRDWERTRARSRSPYGNDRQESYEYTDIRNESRVSSREILNSGGGGTESWGRKPDYSGGSRYGDNRNSADHARNRGSGRSAYDDQDGRRQSTRNSRTPCKFFVMGKCSREDCKFSHDGPESGRYDGRSHDNVRDRNLGHGEPQDDLNGSKFSNFAKSNQKLDDKKKSWDGPSWDDGIASGFTNVGKSNPNIDNKKRPWSGPLWDGVSQPDVSNVPKPFEDSMKPLNDTSRLTMGASGFSYGTKSANNIDGKKKPWNGPIWDEGSESGKSSKWDGRGWNETTSEKNDYLLPQSTSVTIGTDTIDSCAKDIDMVSENANQQILTFGKESVQSVRDASYQPLINLNRTEQSHQMLLASPFNGPKSPLNGPGQGMFLHMDPHKQMDIQNNGGKPLGPSEMDVPRVMNTVNETSVIFEQVPQLNGSQKAQLPQVYTELNLANAIDFLNSLPKSAPSVPCIDPRVFQHDQDTKPKEQYDSARYMESIKASVPMGILSGSARQENQMPAERFPPISTGGPTSSKPVEIGGVEKDYGKSPKKKNQGPVGNQEGTENAKQEQENINPDNSEAQGKVEEGNISNDEKAMRQFKIALVEFVKEILKPTWKEGKMSREVHKTIVKKVVDKVTSTIQEIQIPRTQARIEQYLAFSKSKITKLVEAYVERFQKA